MEFITNRFKRSTLAYGATALALALFAIFIALPTLPQVNSVLEGVSLKASLVAAFGESGDGGCCGGGDVDTGGSEGGDGSEGGGGHKTPPPPQPTCELSVSARTITEGESVTISWTTENASSINLEPGFGSVPSSGSRTASPTEDTTYVLTASWGFATHGYRDQQGEAICRETVIVKPKPKPDPVCDFLTATPQDLTGSGNVTLEWGTTNAENISINQGIGSVADDGSKIVFVDTSKTFVLTAEANGKTDTCSVPVTVSAHPKPTCTLDIDPSTIKKGESATLSWTTTNADSIAIDHGIGSVGTDGSLFVSPNDSTVYKLAAVGSGGKVICKAPITVTEEKPEPPACPFQPKDNRIIIEFTDKIRSDQTFAKSETGHKNVTVPTGTYTVSLASWDGYISRESADAQPNEQWKAIVSDGSGIIAASSVISDVPDGVREAQVQEVVNNALVVSTEGSVVYGKHAVYPDVSSPNSVYPICAAFDPEPVDEDPVCQSFTATPGALGVGGGEVTLAWSTANVEDVSIDNGVGTVSEDGSTVVNVTNDTVFTLTATKGDKTATCEAPVTVATAEDAPKCDFITADPDTLVDGGDVVLQWETTNADSVSINEGVGDVDLDGTTTVNVTESKTFILTATKGDKTDTCEVPVTVSTENGLTCDSFTASENPVNSGSSFTLNWETTGATSASIDQGIGDVSVDGSKATSIDQNTTFTLTATDGVDEVTCQTTVQITTGGGGGGGGGGGSSRPSCEFLASDTKIVSGQEVTLSWDTSRGRELKIEDNRGNLLIDTDENEEVGEGELKVSPTRDTEYTLTVARGSSDRECKVQIEIEEPSITVLSARDQQPLTSISFAEIPYTGFEAGPILTALFYIILVLWSLAIAYILVIQRGSVLGFSLGERTATYGISYGALIPHQEYKAQVTSVERAPIRQASIAAVAPANLPTAGEAPVVGFAAAYDQEEDEEEEQTEDTEINPADDAETALLENHAHEQNVLCSSEALRAIAGHSDDVKEQIAFLDKLIDRAKEVYPREDGWIAINRARMNELFRDESPEEATEEIETPTPSVVGPDEGTTADASSLAASILTGDIAAAYASLGDTPLRTLAGAASDLDSVYRARKRGDRSIAPEVSDVQLERSITALTEAIDGTYSDEAAAVKMAVMKAVSAIS